MSCVLLCLSLPLSLPLPSLCTSQCTPLFCDNRCPGRSCQVATWCISVRAIALLTPVNEGRCDGRQREASCTNSYRECVCRGVVRSFGAWVFARDDARYCAQSKRFWVDSPSYRRCEMLWSQPCMPLHALPVFNAKPGIGMTESNERCIRESKFHEGFAWCLNADLTLRAFFHPPPVSRRSSPAELDVACRTWHEGETWKVVSAPARDRRTEYKGNLYCFVERFDVVQYRSYH